jgi:uncharacterized protein (UPF0262 family)
MKPHERVTVLRASVVDANKKIVRLEREVSEYRIEKSFYGSRVELITDNLNTLKTGQFTVSMTEYKLIVRDYYYNKQHYCVAVMNLTDRERQIEAIKVLIKSAEDEIASLLSQMENNVVPFPTRRKNEQV